MPELHETAMGRQFYDSTMPAIAKALANIATALTEDMKPHEKFLSEVHFTKENILKHASEEELFALFHTFKEYWNEAGWQIIHEAAFHPTDQEIGDIIAKLKKNYKYYK